MYKRSRDNEIADAVSRLESDCPVTEEEDYEIPCICTAPSLLAYSLKHENCSDEDQEDEGIDFLEEEGGYDEMLVAATILNSKKRRNGEKVCSSF